MNETTEPGTADRHAHERHSRGGNSVASADLPDEFDVRKLPPRYQFAFAVVKHFGFPILVSVSLAAWIYYQDANSRADREADRTLFVNAIDGNTQKLSELVQEIRRLEDGHK